MFVMPDPPTGGRGGDDEAATMTDCADGSVASTTGGATGGGGAKKFVTARFAEPKKSLTAPYMFSATCSPAENPDAAAAANPKSSLVRFRVCVESLVGTVGTTANVDS